MEKAAMFGPFADLVAVRRAILELGQYDAATDNKGSARAKAAKASKLSDRVVKAVWYGEPYYRDSYAVLVLYQTWVGIRDATANQPDTKALGSRIDELRDRATRLRRNLDAEEG